MATKSSIARKKAQERKALMERLEAMDKTIASLKRDVAKLKREAKDKDK